MTIYVANAFIQPTGEVGFITLSRPTPLPEVFEPVRLFAKIGQSAIAHQETASILGVEPSKVSPFIGSGDLLVIVSLTKKAAASGEQTNRPEDRFVRVAMYRKADVPCPRRCGAPTCYGDYIGVSRIAGGDTRSILLALQSGERPHCGYRR
jgi:hypothetical protein